MAKCENCSFFNLIPKDADDFEPDKGDCITELKDEKGKYWLSKPIFGSMDACEGFKK